MNLFAGIIFSDAYSGNHNMLAEHRTLASIPFCGRFRTIDFILSSLVNSYVDNVAVVTKRNYASLEDHLGGGRYWDLDHRSSGLRILSPFYRTENNTEVFMARGKLDALRSVQPYIKNLKEEYVVLTNANIIANNIARQVEGRVSYRRAIKMAIATTMRMGAEGIKVLISGRLGGAEMARSELYKEGRTPLHTFRADIDYALAEAHTKVGVLGIKVWVCNGEVYGKRDLTPNAGVSTNASAQGGQRGNERRGGRGRSDRRKGGAKRPAAKEQE